MNDPDLNLTVIDKYDRRTKTTHPSVETDALSQQVIVDIVRRKLDKLLPEPVTDSTHADLDRVVRGASDAPR